MILFYYESNIYFYKYYLGCFGNFVQCESFQVKILTLSALISAMEVN